jgi:predicted 2-oxoglutarate/Fe(II)-dependent dioxygenase YbiX
MSHRIQYDFGPIRNKPFVHLRHEFTPEEAVKAREEGLALELTNSTTGLQGTNPNPLVRRSRTAFFQPTKHAWLYRRVGEIIERVNEQHFGYDLTGIETIQFAEYSVEMLGTYDTHRDIFPGRMIRKLSLSIQLSHATDYDGGDLELPMSHTDTIVASRELGHGLVFPSFALHRVGAVMSGVRYSLVAWIVGPQFR